MPVPLCDKNTKSTRKRRTLPQHNKEHRGKAQKELNTEKW